MPRLALAQTAPTPPTITSNSYSLEIFQGPILAPIHVTGVGGAYVASAEDTEGSAVNPASPAVRNPYSATWFDYDVSLGASLPGAFSHTDFDNHGDFANLTASRAGDFVDLVVGGRLQFGSLGLAATSDLEQFSLTTGSSGATQGPATATMEIGQWKVQGAYALLDGQLVLGAGARIVSMQIHENTGNPFLIQNGTSLLIQGGNTLLTMTGVGPEVGALFMPTGLQWRLGAAARAPVSGGVFGSESLTSTAGVLRAGSFVLPSKVVMPWEVDLGIAYQLGPRPLNPGWENPHEQERWLRLKLADERAARAQRHLDEVTSLPVESRGARAAELEAEEASVRRTEEERLEVEFRRLRAEREARYGNWPREKILLLASVLLTGPSNNAVSIDGFLDQRVETVGRTVSATPRVGLESEPLPDRMLLRVGTYVEPTRYESGQPRQHFTFGGDVRLFPLDFWGLLPQANWKIGVVIDLAPRYTNYGLAIGNWH